MSESRMSKQAQAEAIAREEQIQAIFQADSDAVMNVAFAETFANYRRARLPGEDRLVWYRTDPKQDALPSAGTSTLCDLAALPSVSESKLGMLAYLDELCEQAWRERQLIWFWSLQRSKSTTPLEDGKVALGGTIYICQIVEMQQPSGEVAPVALGRSEIAAKALAACMVASCGVNLMKLHKELFPEKYT